jgi:biotin/methionine sulfoxide reductase
MTDRASNGIQGVKPHTSHWGAFSGEWVDGKLVLRPHPRDPEPNELIQNIPDALRHRARIARPMVRRGWLERGPGPDDRRGRDEFVAMEWDAVIDLLAKELARVRDTSGQKSVFGGSYGWASAGRFHHAQSQIHRFLNTVLGGYVRSVNNYSAGASLVILPHVMGNFDDVARRNVSWTQIEDHTEILLAFGGMSRKNSFVATGGITEHSEFVSLQKAKDRGMRFVLLGPLKDDFPDDFGAEWVSLKPGTDTALMLGMAHTLVIDGTHDRAFLDSHCVGWERFQDYLMGRSDGTPKTAAWASAISGVPEKDILSLTRSLPGKRVLIGLAHSLQRAQHGEQPVWMGAVLAAMLGQIGLPGGGYNYALGAVATYGKPINAVPLSALPQGKNNVRDYIPVARISDMLLKPGEPFDYDGHKLTYPDIKLVYWVGGNPFHHHQDLNRLRRAFARIDTLVVHEIAWTPTARHADIVLPCTMTLERDDIGGTATDPLLIAMHKMAEPFEEARDDYAIFSDLAERLGRKQEFTEGRSAEEWIRHLYSFTKQAFDARGISAPDFDTFWAQGELELPRSPDDGGRLRAFRHDPRASPLATPSGKIEIFSETIASFGYDDCPGHPAWLPPVDEPDAANPLHLVANQPASRLHSQLDFGGHSASRKQRMREVMQIHARDAAARGIRDGDIVKLFNERGACLASAWVTERVREGVVQLPTGAWFDPEDPNEDITLCVHGNPNVLTRDIGTSKLAQGCSGQLTTVQVELFKGNLPPVQAHEPPVAVEAAE